MINLLDHSYEDSFKVLAGQFFSSYGRVTTQFDRERVNYKDDLLIVRSQNYVTTELDFFHHFEQLNLVRFQSEEELLDMTRQLALVLSYLGLTLIEEESDSSKDDNRLFEGVTFTVVHSRLPGELLQRYEKNSVKVKDGVYRINGLIPIPLHIVVCDEVKGEPGEELLLLHFFSTGERRKSYLARLLKLEESGEEIYECYLHYAFALYRDELKELLINEEVRAVSLIEKNLTGWMEDLGLKERLLEEGFKEGKEVGRRDGLKEGLEKGVLEGKIEDALEMLKDSLPLEQIARYTRLPLKQVEELKKSVSRLSGD